MNDINHFSFYLDSLNIKNNQDILVLTSHYYYDIDELRHVNAIIHAKELNQVSNLTVLMSNMMKGLSNGTKFIGCFVDNKFHYRNKIGFWLLHLADMKNNKYMTRKHMIKLFGKYGLQVIDMTEVNGMTYFCVKHH